MWVWPQLVFLGCRSAARVPISPCSPLTSLPALLPDHQLADLSCLQAQHQKQRAQLCIVLTHCHSYARPSPVIRLCILATCCNSAFPMEPFSKSHIPAKCSRFYPTLTSHWHLSVVHHYPENQIQIPKDGSQSTKTCALGFYPKLLARKPWTESGFASTNYEVLG